MLSGSAAAGVPALALVTTIHVAMAAVRNHRSAVRGISSLAVASACFAVLPWVWSGAAGLAAGLGLHALWFVVCERWLAPPAPAAAPVRAAAGIRGAAPAPRPAPSTKPRGFVDAPVLSVIDESPDIRTFRLARPEGFAFEAGQFLAIRLRADGQDCVRCYSISSPPEARGYLEISVKRQGLVSSALHATARAGSLVAIRAPAGHFTYPHDDDRPLLLAAGGVGITPLISMVRHAALAQPNRPITLLYSARQECDLAFREELHWLARRHGRLRVMCAVSRGAPSDGIYPGRIDEALLGTVPDLAHTIALLCGPQGFIDAVSASLASAGVAPAQIRFERFDAAVAATRPAEETRRPAARTFQLRTAPSGQAFTAEPGQTLLEAAEQSGVAIPSLCRAGVCGTCRTRVLEGDVDCTSELLDEDDRRSGYVLACVSSAQSDCVIEG